MSGTITTIETFGDLADDGYGLNIDCNSCGVHRAVDPAGLPREQRCRNRLWRCRECGGVGQIRLAPPVPSIISDNHPKVKPK